LIQIEDYFWLSFLLINDITPFQRFELIKKYKTPKIILSLNKEELANNSISDDAINYIQNKIYLNEVNNQLDYIKNNNNIKLLNIYDKKYPEKLKNIYDPPVVLFTKGNYDILNKNIISIVGCRECSDYGRTVSYFFSKELSKNNIVIASGLAKGIDTYAHYGSVNFMEKSIAVLGCGLDVIYPKQNEKLYAKILECGGAIISEYPIGTKPLKNNFPARNRIISGLSNGVVVIEAKEKSGTLITVDFALEQGRNVYAVPGNIMSCNSYGTNELIKQGAKPVTTPNDILEDFF